MTTSLRPAWLVVLVLATLPHARVRAGDAHGLLRCQTHVARAAERIVRARHRALTTCLDAPATTCRAALATAEAVGARLGTAAKPCLARSTDETLGADGIGWEALAPVCPDETLVSLDDALACLRRALRCAADVALGDAMPEAIPRLAEQDVTIDRSCLVPVVCGDDVREGEEECDDGNRDAGDGCDPECRVEVVETCGDGVVDPEEECDEGPQNSDVLPDHCRTSCLDPYCGDGVVDPDEAEECEPPGTTTCDEDCFLVDDLFAAAATAGTSCDRALAGAVGRVTRKVQRQVGACALALARCSLADDDPSERCLAGAERRCAAAARRRVAVPGRMAGRVAGPCAESAASITERLATAACAAEAAVSRSIPRADELMLTELFDLDGDEAFPCVIDLTELE